MTSLGTCFVGSNLWRETLAISSCLYTGEQEKQDHESIGNYLSTLLLLLSCERPDSWDFVSVLYTWEGKMSKCSEIGIGSKLWSSTGKSSLFCWENLHLAVCSNCPLKIWPSHIESYWLLLMLLCSTCALEFCHQHYNQIETWLICKHSLQLSFKSVRHWNHKIHGPSKRVNWFSGDPIILHILQSY